MRTLLFMPGGLELHIGVWCLTFCQPMLLRVYCECIPILTHACRMIMFLLDSAFLTCNLVQFNAKGRWVIWDHLKLLYIERLTAQSFLFCSAIQLHVMFSQSAGRTDWCSYAVCKLHLRPLVLVFWPGSCSRVYVRF